MTYNIRVGMSTTQPSRSRHLASILQSILVGCMTLPK